VVGHAAGIHEKFVPSFGRRIWLIEAILKISHNFGGLALKLD
jgi:hypothetical protein